MKGVGSFFPFTHLTVWFKQTVLGDAFSQLSIPGEVRDILMRDTFSADGIGFAGLDVPLWAILIVSGLIATACLTIAGLLLGKRVKRK